MSFLKSFGCFGGNKKRSISTNINQRLPPINITCDKCQQQFISNKQLNDHSLTCGTKKFNDPFLKEEKLNPTKLASPRIERVQPKQRKNDSSEIETVSLENDTVKNIPKASGRLEKMLTRKEVPKIEERTPEKMSEDEKIDKFVAELKGSNLKDRRAKEVDFVTRYLEKTTPVKYIIAEKWIDEYTNYLNGDKQPPGAIDNQNMDEKLLRKRDNNKTLYAVNEKIWRFLMKLYGGGPEISQSNPKPVISNTFDSDKMSDTRTIDTTTRSDAMDSTHSSFGFDTSIIKSGPSNIAFSEPVGMVNEMYFCYMNSSMQCILGIDDLVQYTSQERYKKDLVSKNPKFWTSFSEIIYYNNKKANEFAPKLLRKISAKLFEPSEQHDAHEFLRYFLSGMQDEMTVMGQKKEVEFKDAEMAWDYYLKMNPSIIDKIFAGQLVSKVCCCKCGNVSTSYDPFHDLALPISENTKNLDDCIAAFLKDEEIKDCYTCEKCKDNQKSIKKLSINKFPKIFVFHLKRFQTYPVRKKIRDHISFPTNTMKMKKQGEKSNYNYKLIGIMSHLGPMNSGHYVAYTKRGDNWYSCDDENIKKINENDLEDKEAYVLFYERE